jgi:uncharacterized protein YbjT (DUF2867 family)
MTDNLTLVLGGTGKTGSRIVHRLTARDLPVRIGSRSGGLPFDWDRPDTWAPALDGVDAVYISYQPDLAVPGAPDAIAEFAELAVKSGARRLVLLSGRGEEAAQESEQKLIDSGADWTILRCSWFNQNFSEGYLLDPVRAGEVVLPPADAPEPFVDTDDIADAAVAALTDDRHIGQLYELTGPRLLTFADAVSEIAGAANREIRFATVPTDEYTAALSEMDVPEDVIGLIVYLFDTVLDGRNSHVADGVQQALGRPARDFADYARVTAQSGIWNEES